jgi:hypothetical protein
MVNWNLSKTKRIFRTRLSSETGVAIFLAHFYYSVFSCRTSASLTEALKRMASKQRSVKVYLDIISYIGLCLIGGCGGSEHCHRVADRYICYFVPYGARSIGEDWDTASQVCRDNAATLPIIENKTIQALVEKFIKTQLPGLELWTAGRGVRSEKWQWLNGHELQQIQLLDNHEYLSDVHDTHAIITDELSVSGRYPSDRFHSVCQFSGPICQSKEVVAFGDGCLKEVTSNATRWYDARNLCIENGGDLPIFENAALINATHEVFSRLKETRGIWIGLRRTWWNWKRLSGIYGPLVKPLRCNGK